MPDQMAANGIIHTIEKVGSDWLRKALGYPFRWKKLNYHMIQVLHSGWLNPTCVAQIR